MARRQTRQHAAHLARKLVCALFAATLVFALTGCSMVTDSVDTTLQDAQNALDEAQGAIGEAFDEAAGDVSKALEGTQETLSGLSDAPQALMDMFDGTDALISQMASAAVYDAKTGKELAVIDDETRIADVLAQTNLTKLVSSHPDSSTAEYQITFSQNETVKLGQSPEDVKSYEAVTFTTYENSNIVEIFIPAVPEMLGTYDFEVSPEFANALRSLAKS